MAENKSSAADRSLRLQNTTSRIFSIMNHHLLSFVRLENVISEKMEWSFRNSGMLFRNKRNEESFWSKARPFKSYSEASFC